MSSEATSCGFSPQRCQPVHDKTTESGLGTVLQLGPDFIGVPQSDQSDRRPSLTLGETVFLGFGGVGQ